MSYLLDTNALSEASKAQPNIGFMRWLDEVDPQELYTSYIAIGEIYKGIQLLAVSDRQRLLEKNASEILETFNGRVLTVDLKTTTIWGNLLAGAAKAGRSAPVIDTLIAAQCLQHGLVLITRNVKDFEQFTDLKIHRPWSE